VLATLIRVTGQVELAQDAAQDAHGPGAGKPGPATASRTTRAAGSWSPRNAGPWTSSAGEARRAGKETEAMMFARPGSRPRRASRRSSGTTCSGWCSPAATPPWPWKRRWRWRCARWGGLSTAEVARSLLVPEPTMAQAAVPGQARRSRAGPDPLPGPGTPMSCPAGLGGAWPQPST